MCGGRGDIKVPYAFQHLIGNKSGLLLMELRAKFSVGCSHHRIPLISPLTSNVLRTGVSQHMICFTPESILHPFYPVAIKPHPEMDTLPSAAHYVASIALKYLLLDKIFKFRFFSIPNEYGEYIMETNSGSECWHRLHLVLIEFIMPPIDKIQQWYMEERQIALKQALQLAFEQNQAMQRILLETEDALLVSCARFSSIEAELNIGMREQDLRLWLTLLIDLCLRPMAFRAPYLGGNRLGLILMELRREFILQGVFPKQLPVNGLSIETTLGTESCLENYIPHYEFNPLDMINYNALWANPLILMAKQSLETNPELWQKAIATKTQPILLSTITELISESLEKLKDLHKNQRNKATAFMEELDPPVIRSMFRDFLMQIREKTVEDCDIQIKISNKSRESNRMQEIRRNAERTRDRLLNNERNSPQPQQQQQQQQQQQLHQQQLPPLHQQQHQQWNNSSIRYQSNPPNRYRNGNNRRKVFEKKPEIEPVKPKKPKRIVDESELSEGEILSDDE